MPRVMQTWPFPRGWGLAAVLLTVVGCESNRHHLTTAPSGTSDLALSVLSVRC
jgi:hypothetical protein